MTTNYKSLRVDIQALRGFAVAIVVFYHVNIGGLEAGYLGVDVFFVISGFLITTMVAAGISRGGFSLTEFYFRRAKRLLPAAYVTFFVTALLAPQFLTQQELSDFALQVVGALTFTGNLVLWQQTGYFAGAGELKPFLHIWSLAIEEQYYFVLPALLLLAPRRFWLLGAILLVIASLGLCLFGLGWKPIATFYLLPTRAWELLLGSVGALWLLDPRQPGKMLWDRVVRILFVPSLICLLILPFAPFAAPHPGLNAALVCLATLVVILAHSPKLNAAAPVRWLSFVGDISYSLYLVHWPIISLMRNAWVGGEQSLPMSLRLGALALSFGLAYLLYRYIEDPIRRGSFRLSPRALGTTALASLAIVLVVPLSIYAMPALPDFKEIRKDTNGLAASCDYPTRFTPKPECRTSDNPDLLMWGDSFVMHLVPGVLQEWKGSGIIQATRSACAPMSGMAFRLIVQQPQTLVRDLAWAERCIAFNDSVLDYLRAAPSIRYVLLSSALGSYVTEANTEHVVRKDGELVIQPPSLAAAVAGLQQTVEAIRSMGKQVVLVAPPPSAGFNVGACLERRISGTLAFGGQTECVIDRAAYHSVRGKVLELMTAAGQAASLPVIRFDPWLCDDSTCRTSWNDTILYRDVGHLTDAGSALLARQMRLGSLIREQAR